MTTSDNGSIFLGLNVWQDPTTFEITISFKDYLEETLLRLASLPSSEVTLPKVVGILLWLSLILFGTYLGKVKELTRRVNQQLPDDLDAALELLHEIYEHRTQGIIFRQLTDAAHIFRPRTSRVPHIDDVSHPSPKTAPRRNTA